MVESVSMSKMAAAMQPMASSAAPPAQPPRMEREAQVQQPRASDPMRPERGNAASQGASPAPSARVSLSEQSRALAANEAAGNAIRSAGVSAAAQEQQNRAGASQTVAQAINSYATTSSLY